MFQIGLKKFFVIKKVKNTVSWPYVTGDLNGEKIIGTFYEKTIAKNKPGKLSS